MKLCTCMQIEDATSTEELRALLDSDDFTFRFDAGVCMPSSSVTLKNKGEVAKSIAMHFTVLAIKAELDQLKKGLQCLRFLEVMHSYPTLLKPLFLNSGKPSITADYILQLFHVQWSPQGSNQRELEEAVILGWHEYIHDTEGILLCKHLMVLYSLPTIHRWES